MIGEYLLDTNIVIAYLNDEPDVGAKIDAASSIFLSSVVMGELLFGALESTRSDENLARLQDIADEFQILDCDRATAWSYANIRRELRKAGRPIPHNDIWGGRLCSAARTRTRHQRRAFRRHRRLGRIPMVRT